MKIENCKLKNVLIFGKGYIGLKLHKAYNCSITDKKITKLSDITSEIKKYQPKVIINAIGYTGYPNVDDCENKVDTTLEANTFIPILFAEAAIRTGVKLVHISSGCIYNFNYQKSKPIIEKQTPDFFDLFYSRTKIYAERAIEALSDKYNILIVRIRIPLDNQKNPKNLLDKLIRYQKVIDIPNSVTYIPDFILMLKHLIKTDARGIYNCVNKGALRYPKLMREYQKYNPDFKYEIVDIKKVLKTPRTNLIMSVAKLEKSGFKVRKINDVIPECVRTYKR